MARQQLNWADALSISVADDVVPDGWKTIAQIAVEIGRSDSVAGRMVKELSAKGGAERRIFRITTGTIIRPVPHYKLK